MIWHVFAACVAACALTVGSYVGPAAAAQPDTTHAARSTARQIVRYGGELKTGRLYRLLATAQKSSLSKPKFAKCMAPKGAKRTGTHVVRIRHVKRQKLSVYGYDQRLDGVVVQMRVADSGGTHERNFNGGLIFDHSHWRWYLRKRDIDNCK